MRGDRLRCDGCGRYRSITAAVRIDDVFDVRDSPNKDSVETTPCPTESDGVRCACTTATLAGGEE